MDATALSQFKQVVRTAASGRSDVSEGGPNTIDLVDHARRVGAIYGYTSPPRFRPRPMERTDGRANEALPV